MNHWLFPSVVAALLGTLLLTLTYAYLYQSDKKPFSAIWASAWFVSAVRFALMLFYLSANSEQYRLMFSIGNQLTSLGSGLLILWGTYVFIDRKMPSVFVYLSVVSALYILLMSLGHQTIFWTRLPNYFFIGWIFIWTGIIFYRRLQLDDISIKFVGTCFVIWGIHQMDYPFLRPVTWFAPWGYLLGATLEIMIAIGMIMIYFRFAQKQMLESEEKYRELVENANSIILKWLRDGRISFLNEYGLNFFGYRQEEIIGQPVMGTIVPDVEKGGRDLIGLMEDIFDNPAQYEKNLNENMRKDGSRAWIAWTNRPIRNDHGTVIGMFSVGTDITELKRMEETLSERENFLETLLYAIPIPVFYKDGQGRYLEVNRAFETFFGATRKKLLGKTVFDILPPDLAARYHNEDTDLFEAKGRQQYESRVIDAQGKLRDVIYSSVVFTDRKAAVSSLIGALLDITDRKQAEDALAEAKGMLEAAIAHSPVGIIVADAPHVTIRLANAAALAIRGGDPGILSGIDMSQHAANWQVFRPDGTPYAPEALPLSRAVLAGEDVHDEEMIMLDEEGKKHWVSTNAAPIRNKDGQIVSGIVVFLDITERKRAEAALRENEEKLARSKKMESLGLLAGGVAHDLNNVLAGIVSYPELLLMGLPEDSNLRKPIEIIQASGNRAASIVQDLLTVARGVAITRETLNLNGTIEEYLKSPEFKKLMQYHPAITLKTALEPELLNIKGSPIHIRKVVMNLVANASEAITGKGTVTLSTVNRYIDRPIRGYDEVTIGEYAVLVVSDDGGGISPEDLDRIFEPFYTKKVMGKSGTGLGLAVVWNVLQDHDGYIDVISDPHGTSFELYFPITREKISLTAASSSIQEYTGHGETVLVIDDVKSQREISCKLLEALGYRPTAVSGGEEAIAYLTTHHADLVLLDMIMEPGINGRETYERIIERHPHQKAVIVSGFAETDEVRQTQQLGAGLFVKKPLTLKSLGLAVKETLAESR